MAQGPTIRRSTRLEEELQRALRKRERLTRAYLAATESRQRLRMNHIAKRLADTVGHIEALAQIEAELSVESKPRQYVISSLFLYECFKDLTADAKEQLFFITGSEVNGICILDQKAEFAHRRRSVTGVEGEVKATHAALIKLERFGHRLLAHFHSHPGPGIGMTKPSGIDVDFQERLERGGFPNIAAIFSRDGYIRFFRLDKNLHITIHGKGVEEIEPNVYKLMESV